VEPLIVEREVVCGSGRQALWRAVADTNRLNRAMGGLPLQFEPLDGAGAARYLVTTRQAGLSLSYEERPYEWRQPEFLIVTRPMRTGPLARYRIAFRLDEHARGTRLALRLEVTPSTALAWPVVMIQARRTMNQLAQRLVRVDENLRAGLPPWGEPATRLDDAQLARLQRELERVAGADATLAQRLVEWVRGAPDFEVQRIRPFELADRWEADRRRVLTVCLHAVEVGLLELEWEVLCPSCRVAAVRSSVLSELGDRVHCRMCDLTSAVDFDRTVEAVVRPRAAVRTLPPAPYCIAGPYLTPHVLEQAILPANGEARLVAPTEPGRYRLFVRGGAVASVEVVKNGDPSVELTAAKALAPGELRVAPGATLLLRDILGEERHVKLERLEWASAAATGLEVSTLPAFRRAFSAQVLRPGVLLKVGRVAFLFSDLSGSTAFYARVGDAQAYAFVRDHFASVFRIVEAERGAVVKTIGDSVMAAFVDERDALRAAVAMQRAHRQLRLENDADVIGLKVGVFAGPCYVVTANGSVDYFGQTVNIAQRLESVAADGDIIVSRQLARAAGEAGWLEGVVTGEELSATLKGLQPMAAVRLRVE
jgi:class 3 adenylate cyclase